MLGVTNCEQIYLLRVGGGKAKQEGQVVEQKVQKLR